MERKNIKKRKRKREGRNKSKWEGTNKERRKKENSQSKNGRKKKKEEKEEEEGKKVPDQRNRRNVQKGLLTRQYLNNTELSYTRGKRHSLPLTKRRREKEKSWKVINEVK